MEKFEQGLISIIVPVHNSSATLGKCVETLINQTYTNLEIFLVNNGSQDNSLSLCNELANKDNRIVVLNLEEGNVSKARNAGLDVMRGEYFAFVDSDDYVDLTMYEKLYDKAKASEADIVYCKIARICGGNIINGPEKRLQEFVCSKNVQFMFKSGEDYVERSSCRTLFKSDVYKNLRLSENLFWGEDFAFMMQALMLSFNATMVDERLYFYELTSVYQSKKYFRENLIENDKLYVQNCNKFLNFFGCKDFAKAVAFETWIHVVHSFIAYSENYKAGVKKIEEDEFWKKVNNKENYNKYLKLQCSGFKFRIRAYLLRHKMFGMYKFMLKFVI